MYRMSNTFVYTGKYVILLVEETVSDVDRKQ